ncbi:MAG: hypothetical protein LBN03_01210 [Bifidobacteriaceae bacterium]|jgi:PDZ domain-containing protein|nr:hypothetical protein [Bifidobacteriaceae bacterium]
MNEYIKKVPTLVYICIYLFLIIIGIILCLPSPYILRTPGMTANVIGDYQNADGEKTPMITVKGVNSDSSSFNPIYLTTVYAYGGPTNHLSPLIIVNNLFSPTSTVLPQELYYPPTQSSEEANEESHQQMDGSKNSAITVALSNLGNYTGVSRSYGDITIESGDIGGPSAGLAFTLGIIQKIKGTDLFRDDRGFAATGEMLEDGKVGPIGGIGQKITSVQKSGAALFLIPKDNCDEAQSFIAKNNDKYGDDAITVLTVENIKNALEILNKLSSNGTNWKSSPTLEANKCLK